MVISRKEMSYQRAGTTSNKASTPDIFQESKLYFNSIHIQMDNIVTLTYLKKIIKHQKMTILSKEIWKILISVQIMITVE